MFSLFHTLQITIGHTRSSQSVTVITSRCSVAASIGGRSPSCRFPKCTRPQLPASDSNSSQRLMPNGYLTHQLTQIDSTHWTHSSLTVLLISRHGPHRKHRSCLLFTDRCIVTVVVWLLASWSLPINGSTCHNTFWWSVLTNVVTTMLIAWCSNGCQATKKRWICIAYKYPLKDFRENTQGRHVVITAQN
jgi:hypothetical protein